MASKNLNNILKTTRLNLNSKILSKNTTEIVKSCVGKIYRQLPMTFKQCLKQVKTDASKLDNHAPIAALQMQERRGQRLNPLMIKPTLKEKPISIKRPNIPVLPAYKKLLQIPPSRLFNAIRNGPGTSSSKASLSHRYNENQRSTRALNFQPLNCMQKAMPVHRNCLTLMIPARNQHISSHLGSLPQAVEISSTIQRDLMIIDSLLKNRLNSASNMKQSNTKTNVPSGVINVRDHCRTTHILATRNEQTFAKSELNQQYKNFQTTTHSKQIGAIGKLKPQSQTLRHTPTTLRRYRNRCAFQRTPPKSSALRVDELSKKTTKIISNRYQATRKEMQTKANPKKTIQTLLHPNEKRLTKTTNGKVKDKSSSLLWELDNLHKPFKVNGKVAPSATYCWANLKRVSRINYIVQPTIQ